MVFEASKSKARHMDRTRLSLCFKSTAKRKIGLGSSAKSNNTYQREYASTDDLLSMNDSILGNVSLCGERKENQESDVQKRQRLDKNEQNISTTATKVANLIPSTYQNQGGEKNSEKIPDVCNVSYLGVSHIDWDETLTDNGIGDEQDAKLQSGLNGDALNITPLEQLEDIDVDGPWENSFYVPRTPENRTSITGALKNTEVNIWNGSKTKSAVVQSTNFLQQGNPELCNIASLVSVINWDETLTENNVDDVESDVKQQSEGQNENPLHISSTQQEQVDDEDNQSIHVPKSSDVEPEVKQLSGGQNDYSLSDSPTDPLEQVEDDEDNRPWENSVYVPRTPEERTRCSSKISQQSTPLNIVHKVNTGVVQLTNHILKRNTELGNITNLGVSLIDWDETLLEIGIKSPKITFHEKFQRQLVENGKKPKNVNSHTGPDVTKVNDEGPFFGLPYKVKELIKKLRGISDLYDWQKRCLSMPEVQARKNLVYALPTSGGKTLVAEILLLKEALINKKDVIFILPYVSIVQEKVRALSQLAVELDFFVEEYALGKGAYPPRKRRCKNSVFIATIEKALGLVHSLLQERRLHEVGLVIVDELHLLGEGSRGATLEGVLTKLMFVQEEIQIVGMSATIGNLHEIAAFLNAKTFTEDFRPVELLEYIKCGDSIYRFDRQLVGCDSSPLVLERTIQSNYTPQELKNDPDHIGTLVMEVIPDESCLVFCPSRKNCENVALLICKTLPSTLMHERKEEKRALYRALIAEGNGCICPILKKTLPLGIAYHHSGLTTAERRLLEEAFLAKTICVICCTSTLAAGVNLPARRVILRSPYIGTEFIDLGRYKQMVGRAGRAGFGECGESIMLCLLKDMRKVTELLSSSMNESLSCLAADHCAGMKAVVMSSVGLGLAECRANLHRLVKHSLLWVQADKLGAAVKELVDKCVVELLSEGGFSIVGAEKTSVPFPDPTIIVATVPHTDGIIKPLGNVERQIGLHTQLRLSNIGEAAVRGSITMVLAQRLYEDLRAAQNSLVLLNYLHLLYIVTPYQMIEQIKYERQVYFNVFMELSSEEVKVANTLGITEAVMIAIVKGTAVKTVNQVVLDRFYLTLILYELWQEKSIWHVSDKYQVSRGQVYSLLTAASAFASSALRFSEALEEFWCFQILLVKLVQRLSHCCSTELIPLMELPAVKIVGADLLFLVHFVPNLTKVVFAKFLCARTAYLVTGRARQLYNAGYRTLRDVAAAEPGQLIRDVDHMPRKTAYQIIAAAKLLLIQKAEALRDEAAAYLEGLTVKIRTESP